MDTLNIETRIFLNVSFSTESVVTTETDQKFVEAREKVWRQNSKSKVEVVSFKLEWKRVLTEKERKATERSLLVPYVVLI